MFFIFSQKLCALGAFAVILACRALCGAFPGLGTIQMSAVCSLRAVFSGQITNGSR
jgi:hypothetical protein